MTCVVVVGTQWGDEGKGKIVDLLTEQADAVVRYQGGNNAGHTVMFEDKTFILHMVPSGILQNTISILGNGMVIDLNELLNELNDLKRMDIPLGSKLKLSHNAHLVMPYHRRLDVLEEEKKGSQKIGTTGRGIGPAYKDKVDRSGVRLADLEFPEALKTRLEAILEEKNFLVKHYYKSSEPEFSAVQVVDELMTAYEPLKEFVCDASLQINQWIDEGKHVLFEGAQGTFLDVDHGTYPFVTSSNTLAGGACSGTGVGPGRIKNVLGITKAYTTRVGMGPFPTELHDEDGDFLRKAGQEFGATTGRSRRCGWFDAVLVRQSVRLNGITAIALTKLDVLDTLETIKIAVAYQNANGEQSTDFPMGSLEGVTPVYEEVPGWQCSTRGITKEEELPEALQNYIAKLETLIQAPVSIISTGPRREETLMLNPEQLWK